MPLGDDFRNGLGMVMLNVQLSGLHDRKVVVLVVPCALTSLRDGCGADVSVGV